MATVISTTFRLKRGTAERWQELNLVLDQGEPGFELDTYRLKVGDGQTAWNDLPYIGQIVTAATHSDFPKIGSAHFIYKAEQEKTLYQWNPLAQSYEALGASGGGGSSVIVDTELSDTSLNPIANKTVTEALKKVNYQFGDGFVISEVDGVKHIELDLDELIGVDISSLATKKELEELFKAFKLLEEQVENLSIPTKLSELTNDSEFITIKDVEDKNYLTEVPEGYAKISDIPSLDGYAKVSDIPSLEGYAKVSDIPSLDGYAKTEDIPSLEGYATEQFVKDEIDKIEIPSTDLSNYYTKEEVDSKDAGLKSYVDEEISKAVIGGEIDLTAYAKKEYVDEQLQSFTPVAIVYGEF